MINKSYRFRSHEDATAFASDAACLAGVETVNIVRDVRTDDVQVDVSMTEVPPRLLLFAMYYEAKKDVA